MISIKAQKMPTVAPEIKAKRYWNPSAVLMRNSEKQGAPLIELMRHTISYLHLLIHRSDYLIDILVTYFNVPQRKRVCQTLHHNVSAHLLRIEKHRQTFPSTWILSRRLNGTPYRLCQYGPYAAQWSVQLFQPLELAVKQQLAVTDDHHSAA